MKNKITKTSEQETQTLRINKEEGKSEIRMVTESQLSPAVLNALTFKGISQSISDDVDLTEAVEVMKEKSEKIIAGDLSELESALYTQVVCLNSIFSAMTLRSAANLGNSIKLTEAYMRLALKAQAQCARTAEILAAIKNPPIVYAKQANIAQGHQQINNGNLPPCAREKNENSANELLSEDNHAALDTRGTVETGATHQEMAAVETINGSKNT